MQVQLDRRAREGWGNKSFPFSSVLFFVLFIASSSSFSFDTTTQAKVLFIDEWDTNYTKVQIDGSTSCGSNWFWMSRGMDDYDIYMSRVLAALVSDRPIRITERAPAWCTGTHLYNPRIGVN